MKGDGAPARESAVPAFLLDGGELGALMRAHPWDRTPLGPIRDWPASLRTLAGVMLGSRQPMFIAWGPQRTMLYNDGYARMLGRRHPDALGRPFREVWYDILDDVGPILERAFAGESTHMDDIALVMHRHGDPEEAHFAFSYTPVREETGVVAGMFCACTETTETVRAQRSIREMAKAARETNARLQLVQSAGGIGSFDWDMRTGRIFRSREYLVLHGLPEDSPLEDTFQEGWLERVHPDDRARVKAGFEDDVARGGPFEREYRIKPADSGPVRWLLNRGRIDLDADRRPVRLVSAQSDITARKAVEAALRESEERLRLAQDAAGVGTFDWDLRTGRTELSDGYLAIMGFEPGERVTQAELVARAHPDDRARLMNELSAASTGAGLSVSETRMLLPSGEVRWVQSNARTLFDENGVAYRRMGVIQDTTVRRTAEEALRESETNYRYAAELNPQVAWTATPDGQLDRVAERWREWTGHSGLGESWGLSIHPDDLGPSVDAWTRSVTTGEPYDIEHRTRLVSGEYRWVHSRAYPRHDAAGRIVKWYGSTEDVHERRLASDALRELNETLEARVEARTEALRQAEEQLRQAQKMEAVGQLTGGIAHDFNNLLQGITGSLELIRTRVAQGRTGDLEPLLDGATASADRAAALTHRLLAFSRRQPLDPKPVRVDRLVTGMGDLLRRTLGEAIMLELVLAGGLWTTLCDANQLENALLNLAINARDAMPEGGRMTIETCNVVLDAEYAGRHRDIRPGAYVCVAVADTGVGMPPEVAERAFEPFFTTKPTGQGTGLGLSMIYGFARQSEGHVAIHSEVGRGTTVRLYLPRHVGVAEVEAVRPPPSVAPAEADGGTVLVIEDEPVVRGLILEVLRDLGYSVLEAVDGPSGLAKLRSSPRIDLIVTDIGLPGMNGRQVAEAARSERPDTKVLFMTGYAENAAVANGFLEPGMAMVTKPFAMDQLLARIREMTGSAAPVERPGGLGG